MILNKSMKMKKQLASSLAVAFSTVLLWSCNQSDPAAKGDYVSGVFVSMKGISRRITVRYPIFHVKGPPPTPIFSLLPTALI